MAKTPLTPAERQEVANVRNTEGTFELPIDADLELRNSDGSYGAAYGSTDPDIEASFVNIKHFQANNMAGNAELIDLGTISAAQAAGTEVISHPDGVDFAAEVSLIKNGRHAPADTFTLSGSTITLVDTENFWQEGNELVIIHPVAEISDQVFVGATTTSDGEIGFVPQPLVADRTRFLRGDGTWGAVDAASVFSAESSDGAGDESDGIVPGPTYAERTAFLRGDGAWAEVPAPPVFSRETSTDAEDGVNGLVPAPEFEENLQFLRGDGEWALPHTVNRYPATYTEPFILYPWRAYAQLNTGGGFNPNTEIYAWVGGEFEVNSEELFNDHRPGFNDIDWLVIRSANFVWSTNTAYVSGQYVEEVDGTLGETTETNSRGLHGYVCTLDHESSTMTQPSQNPQWHDVDGTMYPAGTDDGDRRLWLNANEATLSQDIRELEQHISIHNFPDSSGSASGIILAGQQTIAGEGTDDIDHILFHRGRISGSTVYPDDIDDLNGDFASVDDVVDVAVDYRDGQNARFVQTPNTSDAFTEINIQTTADVNAPGASGDVVVNLNGDVSDFGVRVNDTIGVGASQLVVTAITDSSITFNQGPFSSTVTIPTGAEVSVIGEIATLFHNADRRELFMTPHENRGVQTLEAPTGFTPTQVTVAADVTGAMSTTITVTTDGSLLEYGVRPGDGVVIGTTSAGVLTVTDTQFTFLAGAAVNLSEGDTISIQGGNRELFWSQQRQRLYSVPDPSPRLPTEDGNYLLTITGGVASYSEPPAGLTFTDFTTLPEFDAAVHIGSVAQAPATTRSGASRTPGGTTWGIVSWDYNADTGVIVLHTNATGLQVIGATDAAIQLTVEGNDQLITVPVDQSAFGGDAGSETITLNVPTGTFRTDLEAAGDTAEMTAHNEPGRVLNGAMEEIEAGSSFNLQVDAYAGGGVGLFMGGTTQWFQISN